MLWNGDSAPDEALAVSVGRPVVAAFRRLKSAFFGSIVMFALITLLTGYILAGVVAPIVMLAYRPYVLHRDWLRPGRSEGDLELRGVSEGFQTHIDSVTARQKRAREVDPGRSARNHATRTRSACERPSIRRWAVIVACDDVAVVFSTAWRADPSVRDQPGSRTGSVRD